jgi:hypothetical protein
MQPPNQPPHESPFDGRKALARFAEGIGRLRVLWPWFDFSDAGTPDARRRQFRQFIILTAIAIGVYQVQTFLSNTLTTPATPHGMVDLELAGNPAVARDVLRQWSGDGHMTLRLALLALAVNSVYVYFYVPVVFMVGRWIKQNIEGPQSQYLTALVEFGGYAAAIMLLAGCFDWLENLSLALLLATSWQAGAHGAWLWVAIPTALFAACKFALFVAAGFYAIVALPQTKDAQSVFKVWRLVGVNLLLGIAPCALLILTSQGQEILRVLGEDLTGDNTNWASWLRALLLFFSVLYLAHNSWDWAQFLVTEETEKRDEITPGSWPLVQLPRLCGILPLVLMAMALWTASLPVATAKPAADVARSVGLSPHATIALWILSALMAAIMVACFKLKEPLRIWKPVRVSVLGAPRAAGRGGWILSALVLGALLIPLSAGEFGNGGTLFLGRLGAASVVLLAFSFFVPVGSALVWLRVHKRINAPVLLLAWLFVCASFDLGDNHEVRSRPGNGRLGLRMDSAAFQADLQKSVASASAGRLFNGEITTVDIRTGKPMDPDEILDPRADLPLYDLNDAFTAWLANRRDLAAWSGGKGKSGAAAKPYPVFFIAAEGGGIRAAYETADLLATIQQSNPTFAQHTFMISGVSGGSLGGAVFAALTRYGIKGQEPVPGAKWHTAVDNILKHDLLTPPLAGMLSADLVQRVIPIAMPRADRARALEIALENAWDDGIEETDPAASRATKRIMRSSMYRIYGDFTTASTPAVFFNSTCAQTGQRLVCSPLWPRDHLASRVVRGLPAENDGTVNRLPGISGLQCLSGVAEKCDLNLSTASVLSARFPGVSSSGGLVHRRLAPFRPSKTGDPIVVPLTFQRRYVDGGYYENSGLSTLNDILTALGAYDNDWDGPPRKSGRAPWYPVIVTINFQDTDSMAPMANMEETFPVNVQRQAFDELSPLQTFVAIYGAHGVSAEQRIDSQLVTLKQIHGDARWLPFTFRITDAALPLGWLLSKAARDSISQQTNQGPNQQQVATLRKLLNRENRR